jgi:DNA-binding LytR/AlgR family response regulator
MIDLNKLAGVIALHMAQAILSSIEKRLTGNAFFRSHQAYIVNLNMIGEIQPWGKSGYEITFSAQGKRQYWPQTKPGNWKK